ncbi:MAG: OmpA family protein [Oscillospiraceae bacterium]|jgi:chemotaxis protein MotB|nr:OmpA family protein [Oscillospiraceae bacterium]
MRKKKRDESSGGPNWLDTYADMVTLLLTFFVLLFSMSTMSSSKWQKLVVALTANVAKTPVNSEQQVVIDPSSYSESAAPDAAAKDEGLGLESQPVVDKVTDFDQLYAYLKHYIEKNNLDSSVKIYKGDGYTFLSFRNSIFFDGDSSVLRAQGKVILNYLCDAMSNIPDQIGEIRFYGHTAKVSETNTPERQAFDRGLSDDRAKNVLLYVQTKGIISGAKMVSEGYGEYRPIVPDDGTEATRSKNRRVEIYLSKTGKTADVLDRVYEEISASSKAASSTG